jgi:hypothetical protein
VTQKKNTMEEQADQETSLGSNQETTNQDTQGAENPERFVIESVESRRSSANNVVHFLESDQNNHSEHGVRN